MPDALKQLAALRAKHRGQKKYRPAFPVLNGYSRPALSDAIGGDGGYKRDPLAHRWKRGREESPETVREIEAKKRRVAPLANKGHYGYLTPETDATTIGRK